MHRSFISLATACTTPWLYVKSTWRALCYTDRSRAELCARFITRSTHAGYMLAKDGNSPVSTKTRLACWCLVDNKISLGILYQWHTHTHTHTRTHERFLAVYFQEGCRTLSARLAQKDTSLSFSNVFVAITSFYQRDFLFVILIEFQMIFIYFFFANAAAHVYFMVQTWVVKQDNEDISNWMPAQYVFLFLLRSFPIVIVIKSLSLKRGLFLILRENSSVHRRCVIIY